MQWFYIGDIGRFHLDGCLEITDGEKEIFKKKTSTCGICLFGKGVNGSYQNISIL